MSVQGIVKDGVVVLPPGTDLPNGAEVRVETLDTSQGKGPLAAVVKKLAKPRPHLPGDYALNHGHYLRGEAKK